MATLGGVHVSCVCRAFTDSAKLIATDVMEQQLEHPGAAGFGIVVWRSSPAHTSPSKNVYASRLAAWSTHIGVTGAQPHTEAKLQLHAFRGTEAANDRVV